jgi:predicted RNA-binding protein with PIN domain
MISDKTKINLSLAVVAIGGGATWITSLAADVQQTKSDIRQTKEDLRQIQADQKLDRAVVYQIATDIAVIKQILEAQKARGIRKLGE